MISARPQHGQGGVWGADADERWVPPAPLSLDEAVAAALAGSPELQAHAAELRAEEARTLQEGLLPNPVLSTEIEDFGRFGGDAGKVEGTQTTVSLAQLVELGGKRGRRLSVARLDGRVAGWDYERVRREIAAVTRKRFVAALLARDRVVLAVRLAELARESVTAVRRQVEAGAGAPVELVRAEAALAQAEATAARRAHEAQAARIALAATWGGTGTDVTMLAGTLGPVAMPPPLATLQDALRTSPERSRSDATVERAEAAVALEEARRVPDVTLRLGARRFVAAETNAFVAEVALPLPVFNRNQGALAEASARADKARAERRTAAVGAEAVLAETYEDLVAAYEHARRLADTVVPRAEAAVAGTRQAHAQGMVRSLDVLEAQRTVATVEEDHLEALARYQTAAADLERLTGLAVGRGERR